MSTWTARAKAPGTDIRGLTSTALGNVKRRNACPAPSAATALRRLAAALSLSFRRSPSGVRDRSSDPTPSDSRRRPRGELDFPFFLRAFAGPRSPAQAPLNGRSSCSASPLRRSSERRSHRACGGRLATGRTAAGLLLAGAVLLAAPVLPGAGGAVRAEVLVSNIGLGAESANIAAIDYDYAQAFTTGSNSQGYTLTSVEIGIETTETPTASLSIHRSTSNAPGSVVGTLTSPGTLIQGINTFTHSGLSLAPNTTYFVVIGFQNVTATNTTLEYTRSNSESGATGWSIGDNSHGRPGDNWAEFRNSMQIRVSGRANSPIATITAGTSPVTEGTAATFTVTLAAAAPDGGVTVNLRVSESDGSDYVAPGDEGSKTLAIAAGQTSGTYRVATVDDGDDEPDGSVTVTLASGTGYTLGSPTSASVTVRDNDEDLEPSFGDSSIANQSYTENVPIADLTLPAATGGNGTLRYSLSPDATERGFQLQRRIPQADRHAERHPERHDLYLHGDGHRRRHRHAHLLDYGGGGAPGCCAVVRREQHPGPVVQAEPGDRGPDAAGGDGRQRHAALQPVAVSAGGAQLQRRDAPVDRHAERHSGRHDLHVYGDGRRRRHRHAHLHNRH